MQGLQALHSRALAPGATTKCTSSPACSPPCPVSRSSPLPACSSRRPLSRTAQLQHSRRQPGHLPAAAAAAAAPATDAAPRAQAGGGGAGARPTSAQTARTIVSIEMDGTLCTLGADGIPLGTYASYVLDASGQPLLRLRSDAVHTANLLAEPRASLFVVPKAYPQKLLARATLIGRVLPLGGDDAEAARAAHFELHAGAVGVDAPQDNDMFYRLQVERVFYVGGMGTSSEAEQLTAEEYAAAEPDPLRSAAPALVAQLNEARREDVLHIAGDALGVGLQGLSFAELLWVDRLGLYLYAETLSGGQMVRVGFTRPVDNGRAAKSMLTMLAQQAWERERKYKPQRPPPLGGDDA